MMYVSPDMYEALQHHVQQHYKRMSRDRFLQVVYKLKLATSPWQIYYSTYKLSIKADLVNPE